MARIARADSQSAQCACMCVRVVRVVDDRVGRDLAQAELYSWGSRPRTSDQSPPSRDSTAPHGMYPRSRRRVPPPSSESRIEHPDDQLAFRVHLEYTPPCATAGGARAHGSPLTVDFAAVSPPNAPTSRRSGPRLRGPPPDLQRSSVPRRRNVNTATVRSVFRGGRQAPFVSSTCIRDTTRHAGSRWLPESAATFTVDFRTVAAATFTVDPSRARFRGDVHGGLPRARFRGRTFTRRV